MRPTLRLILAYAVVAWVQIIRILAFPESGAVGVTIAVGLATAGLVSLSEAGDRDISVIRLVVWTVGLWCISFVASYGFLAVFGFLATFQPLPPAGAWLFGPDASLLDVVPAATLAIATVAALWGTCGDGTRQCAGALVLGACAVVASIVAVRVPQGADERASATFLILYLPLLFSVAWCVAERKRRH